MTSQFLRKWMLISLALHLIAALFSVGFQNSDEHFQILEFLHVYLGLGPATDLAIEYQARLRPWFQPMLYLLPTKVFQATGVENPFWWATSYQILSSLIGWASVVALASCVPIWIREAKWQRIAVVFLALAWILPPLHARHSSENLSGALFAIGLAAVTLLNDRGKRFSYFLIPGILLGLAFEARFQVGIMVASLVAWLVLRARIGVAKTSVLLAGIAIAVVFGAVLDRIGYGEWTFTPWNYLKFNLLDGHAAAAGVSPWWGYFRRSWTESWPLLGFLVLIGMISVWVVYPWHILTWSTLPFFVVHCILAHKETRFIFPLVHLAPVMAAMALLPWELWLQGRGWKLIRSFLIAMNMIALLALSLTPAWMPLRLQKKIWDTGITELQIGDENPYTVLGIPMNFYRPPGLKVIQFGETRGAAPGWFASRKPTSPPGCALKFSSLPEWIPASRANRWRLYRCD